MELIDSNAPELLKKLAEYLGCPCRYFPPMADDDPLMDAYREAKERGSREGFLPMIIPEDETLWECLLMNADREGGSGEEKGYTPARVAAYRKEMAGLALKDGKEVASQLLELLHDDMVEDGFDWEAEILGKTQGGESMDRFVGYWDYDTEKTMPLLLAEVPATHPWEVFAWLPFGGWNECPDTPCLMAVTKYWYERHGAVPAVMTHDVLEFDVPAPVSKTDALELALEQYAWCPDVVDQGPEDCTVGMLADSLRQSTTWYFWWD